MIEKDAFLFLERLLTTPSPTGYESRGQKVWSDYISRYADQVESDAYGSVYGKLNVSDRAPTIMLEAHGDEIGMVVQHIDESGFIYVSRLGGSEAAIARARKVHIHSRSGTVAGVVGNTAIHLQDRDKDNRKVPAWKDVFIDIGASDREEALQLVQIGDPVTYASDFEMLTDTAITGRGLDNRIGGFVIAEVMRRLSGDRSRLGLNVIALNSVQEEIGGFGARMMSYRLMPELALITDVTHATDTPGINQKEHGQIKSGNGPVVTHGSANHPVLVSRIEQVAGEQKIAIQHEAAGIRTGTDADSIFYQRSGIPSGLVSLPLRYMHSPVETASLNDVQNLIELMTRTVESIKPEERFSVL